MCELASTRPQSIGQGKLCLWDLLGGVPEGGSCLLSLTSADLAQQVEQLNAKIENTYKEVNFLSTYMDHEYPIKSVQIANLTRQLQQIKDSQQVGEFLALPRWPILDTGLAAHTLLWPLG